MVGTDRTLMVTGSLWASPSGLPALTRNVKLPAVVGVPDRAPSAARVSPSGREPSLIENAGAGNPVAVKWSL